jgi:hypothetical protein
MGDDPDHVAARVAQRRAFETRRRRQRRLDAQRVVEAARGREQEVGGRDQGARGFRTGRRGRGGVTESDQWFTARKIGEARRSGEWERGGQARRIGRVEFEHTDIAGDGSGDRGRDRLRLWRQRGDPFRGRPESAAVEVQGRVAGDSRRELAMTRMCLRRDDP